MTSILLFTQMATNMPFLSPVFGSHMVLQRDKDNSIWGWTKPGETVTVQILKTKETATTDATGKWMVKIRPPRTGGPYKMTVSGSQTVELEDILVGDVWVCSGQSNMEMGIAMAKDSQQEIRSANFPKIRLFSVPKVPSISPLPFVNGEWAPCSPESIAKGGWGGFSAVGYYFGREMHRELNVPVGLVHTSWGGTPAEAWTSEKGLDPFREFRKQTEVVKEDPNWPTSLYNGMINPLLPMTIRGAIWYQGESNVGRAEQYERLLPAMINDWRKGFAQGNFPFFVVQLANYGKQNGDPVNSGWAELREAQETGVERARNAGMAVTIDIGDGNDIHPTNKQEVGRRLALSALKMVFNKRIESSGPTVKKVTKGGAVIQVEFDHAEGLGIRNAKHSGFAIAGRNGKFEWADAKIIGKTVVLSAPGVKEPTQVRYGWDDDPVVTLFNKAGLPAAPFRTK